jgi:hypothetical protein
LPSCGNRKGLQNVATRAFAALLLATSALVPATVEARSEYKSPRIAITKSSEDAPLLLLVSINKQRIHAFDTSGEIASSRVSTGQPGFDTPTGVFSVLEKQTFHRSNIYDGAPMPHMQRLTWSGIALHAGVVPGYRASHGCIRLPASFAKSLFGITKVGSRVIVTPDEINPIPFSSPRLFKPLPAENPPATARYRNPRVASNDRGRGITEFPKLFGITPALAEAARDPVAFLPNHPRSRAEAQRIQAAKLTKLQNAVRDAENVKNEATAKIKAAAKKEDLLAPKADEANNVLSGLRNAIAASEKQLHKTLAAFEAFHKGPTGAADPATSETRLEDAILDARMDLDEARADLVRAELEFATLLGSVKSVQATKADATASIENAEDQIKSAQAEVAEFKKQIVRSNSVISVFVSLKAQRIYIRQGLEPLLEAPISVNDPDRLYGTHVFTAMGYDESGDNFDWRLVSAQLPKNVARDDDDDGSSRKRKRRTRTQTLSYSTETSISQANVALNAFRIPSSIMKTITERATPGASLIVSDHELPPNENGMGTEFIVITR